MAYSASRDDTTVAKVVSAGALTLLVELLSAESSAAVQRAAAGALRNIAGDVDHQVKVAAAGAIPPLVALLGAHSPAVVQEAAAEALHNIAFDNDNLVKVAAFGAIPACLGGSFGR